MAKCTISSEPHSAQEKSHSFRTLKVRKGHYPRQTQSQNAPYRPEPVPWVEIKGYWLNQAGFTIGTLLSVQVQNGCIILKAQTSPS